MMPGRTIRVAACAPRGINIGGRAANPATVNMLAGKETDPRRVREHVARFLGHHLRLLERAGGAGADVAIIPEESLRLGPFIARHGKKRLCRDAVDVAYDTWLRGLGDICRKHNMFVVGGTMTHRDGKYYNTALMLDPAGEIIAAYDKTHLPPAEAKFVAAGDDLPVFDTPFGKVGFLICWDIIFPESFAVLALKGAQIVFQPTFGHWTEEHDVTARVRASDWSIPLVISMWGGCACIIDHAGEFAARTGHVGDSMAIANVQIGAKRQFACLKDTRKQKPLGRRPELYGILTRKKMILNPAVRNRE